MAELPDGDSIGDYRLLELLGEGAAGRVYLGTPSREKPFVRPGDPVAVKIYKPEILRREHQVDRIRREFQVGSTVHHPHLVRMYEHSLSTRSERPYLIMEYVDGVSLDRWLTMFHPIPGRLRLRLFAQLVEAVAALHLAGAIHRDLKPQNIMISPRFEAKVMDLGVVWTWSDPPITPEDEFLGSIRNSSPEMLFGEDYDQRTDIYSLGTILFSLLHGEPVFAEVKQFARLVETVRHEDPSFDETVAREDETSGRLLTLCRRLLSKSPDDRSATCADVLADAATIRSHLPEDGFEPLHGYVATALTGLDSNARDAVNFVANLVADVAKQFDLYVYQPRRVTDPLEHPDVSPEAVYEQDRARVHAADILFVLLNEPSFGVGQEIEIAAAVAKPTILIWRKGTHLSRMVRGAFTNRVAEIEYSTPEDLSRGLRRSIGGAAERVRLLSDQLARHGRLQIAEVLRSWRMDAGFADVLAFSRETGLPPHLVEALESGKYDNIGVQLLSQVCQSTGHSVGDLFQPQQALPHRERRDPNVEVLKEVAREMGISARVYLDAQDEYLKEAAARGEEFIISRQNWLLRVQEAERRLFQQGEQQQLI